MQQMSFYLDGVLVPPPDNWQDLETELSFENASPQAVLNATKLVWMGENAAFLNTWYNKGLYAGGLGIYEGPSLVIYACSTQDVIFNGICDLTDRDTTWSCDKVLVRIRDKRTDTIYQLLDQVTFGALANPSFTGTGPYGGAWINPKPASLGGDYEEILYQNNNIPDYVEFFTMVLAIYNMVEEAIKIANDISGIIAGIAAAGTVVGLGGVALGVLELIGAVAGLILVCFALVDLFEMAVDYLVSPVFTKLGNSPLTMLQRACTYFGIKFQSSILTNVPWTSLLHMPSKRAWDFNQTSTRSVFFGFLSTYNTNQRMEYDELFNWVHTGYAYGYPDGTIGQFLRDLEPVFNAKAKVIVDSSGVPTLYFERWDYFYNLSSLTLPPISTEAPFRNPNRTNASELAANVNLMWQTDTTDLNTLHFYTGTSCMYQASPKVVKYQQNVTLQNLNETILPFALAHRKDQLTATESIFNQVWNDLVSIPNVLIGAINGVIHFVNRVIRIFGGGPIGTIPTLPSNPFGLNTVGVMYLDHHMTSVPKLLLAGTYNTVYNVLNSLHQPNPVRGWTIDPNNKGLVNMASPNLSARSLMKEFYYSNLVQSVYPPARPWSGSYASTRAGQPYYNQWQLYDEQKIPFCCRDFEVLLNNNIIYDNAGRYGRVYTCKYNSFKGQATLDYGINSPYTFNLNICYIVDGVTNLAAL